ncbi:MAG: hypothetical protein HY718_17310 [Planctomycetes bacterium]|nr:hypothetical protein [Planctomycetota bacterium]
MNYAEPHCVLDLLEPDAERIERGRRRQAALWRHETPDCPPMVLGRSESRQAADKVGPQYLRLCEHQLRGGRAVPEYHQFDHYTLRQQFNDPRAMLVESLWDMIGWARTPGDQQLSFRPNYGVGTVASVFGCGTDMGENDMPWVADRPAKDKLLEVDLDRLDGAGLIPRVIEFIQLAREALRDLPRVHVFMPDLQGPMNTAFLLRQQDVFFDMVDDPDYYHRLMEIVCEIYIRLTRRLKAELGEPLDAAYHGAMYMTKGGARVVDDVSIMLSPRQYEEYSLPYARKCLAPFGGGWIHSCGDISHQLRFYLEAPEIKCVNFGEPEKYDFAEVLPRFAAAGKFCYGGPVRRAGEAVADYLGRVAGYLRTGPNTLIFMPRYGGQDMSEGDWPDPADTLAWWEDAFR